MARAKPEMMKVSAGRDIRDGSVTFKEVPVPPKPRDWSEGREQYKTTKSGEGSLNGRSFKFKAGETLWMNDDEADLFDAYLVPFTE